MYLSYIFIPPTQSPCTHYLITNIIYIMITYPLKIIPNNHKQIVQQTYIANGQSWRLIFVLFVCFLSKLTKESIFSQKIVIFNVAYCNNPQYTFETFWCRRYLNSIYEQKTIIEIVQLGPICTNEN